MEEIVTKLKQDGSPFAIKQLEVMLSLTFARDFKSGSVVYRGADFSHLINITNTALHQ